MKGSWILGLASALCIKLSSSVDDVVWLAPFLTSNSSINVRVRNSGVYIGICIVQTLVAVAIAYSGRAAVERLTAGSKHAWSTEKILTVGAGSLLAIYSLKLGYEYLQELREGVGEGGYGDIPSEEGPREFEMETPAMQEPVGVEDALARSPSGTQAEGISCLHRMLCCLDSGSEAQSRQQALCVVAWVGSLDDLTLFVPMLVGKGFDIIQLILGALIAASSIVLLCVFIGLCKPVADCLSKIPLFMIVISFAVMLLVRGLMQA